MFRSTSGQFEISAADALVARSVTAAADEAWRELAGPLNLPAGFSSPVFVRIVPPNEWHDAVAFRVVVEPGGIVSLRLPWTDRATERVPHALTQALLMRLAVARHGVSPRLTVPRWLEAGAVGWWRMRAAPAERDALEQESAAEVPPALAELLAWPQAGPESRHQVLGALWLFTFLQNESAGGRQWPAFVDRLLTGEEAGAALAASFPGRFTDVRDRELWWQTGWHQVRRLRTLPVLGAAESRGRLEALVRFVVAEGDRDVLVPMSTFLEHAGEPFVAAELQRRGALLSRLVLALHPFYRNAGLSLAAALASDRESAAVRASRCAAFEADWRDATELELATRTALDRLEAARARAAKE